jgi:hypothetical protein
MLNKINITAPDPTDGTSFYRAWGVFNELVKTADRSLLLNGESQLSWLTIGMWDLAFFQRPFTPKHFTKMVSCINFPSRVPTWVDYDDNLLAVPPDNPGARIYDSPEAKLQIKNFLEHADLVTVSTQGLADQFAKYRSKEANEKRPIYVIENYLPIKMQYAQPSTDRSGPFRIFWRGSQTHEADWEVHVDDIVEWSKTKDVELVCVGWVPHHVVNVFRSAGIKVKVYGIMEIIDYLMWMSRGNIADVGIYPLANNDFNRAKSDIFHQECLLAGMTSVGPDWWGHAFGYEPGNMTDQLEAAYQKWYQPNTYKDFVKQQQLNNDERKRKNKEKRMQLLYNMLDLPNR